VSRSDAGLLRPVGPAPVVPVRYHARPPLGLDREVPALLLKVGQYPVHSGGLGVIRTLGRLGVPAYAITEPGPTPAAASRYCTARFVWRVTGREDAELLAAQLRAVGDRIGRPTVLVPVDDEAAVLVAEHQAELSEHFLFPRIEPSLPRRLASKPGLYELCLANGVPAPASVTPADLDEVAGFAATATFPIVVKNAEVFERRLRPVVPGTTVVRSEQDLLALLVPAARRHVSLLHEAASDADGDRQSPGVILQEYVPPEESEDWITHLYCGAGSRCEVMFTGVKVRSWPATAGVTACAYSIVNPALAELSARLCEQVGFRGIADLDWRFDLRDGEYKLVDFNPRTGNQFRLFESVDGVDVVRAQHLDLTGRPVPSSAQLEGKRIIVEHADIPAQFVYRRLAGTVRHPSWTDPEHTSTEFAWVALDDPLPSMVAMGHVAWSAARQLSGRLGRRYRH
jgi:D-aspartate ligase